MFETAKLYTRTINKNYDEDMKIFEITAEIFEVLESVRYSKVVFEDLSKTIDDF